MSDLFEEWKTARGKEPIPATVPSGAIIGGYKVLGLIGRGGSAEVYGAVHVKLGATAAIKILHALTERSRRRFDREAKILAQASHPGFPGFKSSGDFEGRPYVVIELLGDCVLPRTDRGVAKFILRVLDAVETLHRLGFVHRDIKPANILMRGGTEPVLTDFGLACPISAPRQIMGRMSVVDGRPAGVGTPGYAAPEQFEGGEVSAATDVHAVGMLADECFGGKPPRCWRPIIDRATNSRIEIRYPSADEMARAIWRRKWRGRLVGAVALAGAAVILGIMALPRAGDTSRTDVQPQSEYLAFNRTASSAERIAYCLQKAKEMHQHQLRHPESGLRNIPVVSFKKGEHEAFFDLTPEIIAKYGPQVTNFFNEVQRDYEAGRCGRPFWHNTFLIPRNFPKNW